MVEEYKFQKLTVYQLALDYGLPEIKGYYGINFDKEFISQ